MPSDGSYINSIKSILQTRLATVGITLTDARLTDLATRLWNEAKAHCNCPGEWLSPFEQGPLSPGKTQKKFSDPQII